MPFSISFGSLEMNSFAFFAFPQVKGTVFCTDANGALVDITAKSSAYLPLAEACIYRIKNVEEAGIIPGVREEFVIIGENEADDSLILSLRQIQYELAWERCRQLQAEDVVVKGKVGIIFLTFNCYSSSAICVSPMVGLDEMNPAHPIEVLLA